MHIWNGRAFSLQSFMHSRVAFCRFIYNMYEAPSDFMDSSTTYIWRYCRCTLFLPYIQHRKYQIKNLWILPTWPYCPSLHLSRPGTPCRRASWLEQLMPSFSLYSRNSFTTLIWNLAYNGFYYPVCLFCLPNQMAKSKVGMRSFPALYPFSIPNAMHWQRKLSK